MPKDLVRIRIFVRDTISLFRWTLRIVCNVEKKETNLGRWTWFGCRWQRGWVGSQSCGGGTQLDGEIGICWEEKLAREVRCVKEHTSGRCSNEFSEGYGGDGKLKDWTSVCCLGQLKFRKVQVTIEIHRPPGSERFSGERGRRRGMMLRCALAMVGSPADSLDINCWSTNGPPLGQTETVGDCPLA